ncbi:MAG: hypothetical protein OXQ30_16100 [Boseongicola sp.]|nr:hypothetical protein [Boseongicola sp.]
MPHLVVDQVLTGPDIGLSFGMNDLLIVEIGGRTVLYGLAKADGEIVELTINGDGTLTLANQFDLAGSFVVGAEAGVAFYGDVSDPAIMVAGYPSAAGNFVDIDADGTLGSQYSLASVSDLVAPTFVELAGHPAIVSGRVGGGLDVYLDEGPGLTWTSGLNDTALAYLADISASAAVIVDGSQYVVTSSASEHGLTVTEILPDGSMSVSGVLGASEGLPISTPEDLAIVEQFGTTYALIASYGSSSLSSLMISATGSLSLKDHILDSTGTYFQQTTEVSASEFGDFVFVAAGGSDGGMSLFTMLPGGRMVHLESVADSTATTLTGVSGLSTNIAGTKLNIYASSSIETGLTVMSHDLSLLGAVLVGDGSALVGTIGNDQLVGSDMSEAITADDGDDILWDGQGYDTLTGGDGADLFVFSQDGVADSITDYNPVQDSLDLSGFDFLYDVSQITFTPTSDGVVLSYASEIVSIESHNGTSLSAADFSNSSTLNVDRPPLLSIDQQLNGGPGSDTLFGGTGDDTIDGMAGNDEIYGLEGNDILFGGDWHDLIEGGAGDDVIDGGTGLDTIRGGEGDDFIDGGHGGDLIYGDEVG